MKRIVYLCVFLTVGTLLFLSISSKAYAMAYVTGQVYQVVNGVKSGIATNITITWPSSFTDSDGNPYNLPPGTATITSAISGDSSYYTFGGEDQTHLDCAVVGAGHKYRLTPTKPSGSSGHWRIHQSGFGLSGTIEFQDYWETNNFWGNVGGFTVDFEWVPDIIPNLGVSTTNSCDSNYARYFDITISPNTTFQKIAIFRYDINDSNELQIGSDQTNTSAAYTARDSSCVPGQQYKYYGQAVGPNIDYGYGSSWTAPQVVTCEPCPVKSCSIGLSSSSVVEGNSVSVSYSGGSFASADTIRPWIERQDGANFPGSTQYGSYFYRKIGNDCLPGQNCSTNTPTDLTCGTTYYLHCDIPQDAGKCSGNPFCGITDGYGNLPLCTENGGWKSCGNNDWTTLTVLCPQPPTINYVDVIQAPGTTSQRTGQARLSGKHSSQEGSNWLNPINIRLDASAYQGKSVQVYVVGFSVFNSANSFASLKQLIDINPAEGFLLMYNTTGNYDGCNGIYCARHQGAWQNIANLPSGYEINDGLKRYTVFPPATSLGEAPTSLRVLFDKDFGSKYMYIYGYIVDSGGLSDFKTNL